MARQGHRATRRHAERGLVPLQGRDTRDHGCDRWRARFKFPDGFVVNKSRDEVNQGLASAFLQPAPDEYVSHYTPIVVNTGSKLIVMDTGTGEANFERSKGAAGQFNNNLKAAGIDRGQVDMVIVSHFHGDHINGLLTADNKPAFPNAEILVPAAEWKYFMDDAEMGKQTSDRMKGVFAGLRKVFDAFGRKVTQYEPGKEIAPGITSMATFGHTPGTTRSSSRRAMTRCSCRQTSPTRRYSCAIRAGT